MTAQDTIKRGLDLASSCAGLVVLAPVLSAISLAVYVDSPGPVFYRGVRAGRHGRPFRIFKFRTMVTHAEACGSSTTGLADPRITRVGGFLRDRKLDELPQLLNVLRGDMSLVGPRPELYEHTDAYSPDERAILEVKPGITDLASLEFFRLDEAVGGEDPDEVYRTRIRPRKNRLRLQYVAQRSLSLDLTILARTAARVIGSLLGRA